MQGTKLHMWLKNWVEMVHRICFSSDSSTLDRNKAYEINTNND